MTCHDEGELLPQGNCWLLENLEKESNMDSKALVDCRNIECVYLHARVTHYVSLFLYDAAKDISLSLDFIAKY